jgi:hypothetical protein
VYQWVHQLSESGAFDDPEFQLLAQSWRHLSDAVKSGMVAMANASQTNPQWDAAENSS